jgi:hypothetical protein
MHVFLGLSRAILPFPADYSQFCAERTDADTRVWSDLIDKKTHEIRQDDDKTVYKSLDEIGDDLPDHSPRFILLSYPLTLVRNSLPRLMETADLDRDA